MSALSSVSPKVRYHRLAPIIILYYKNSLPNSRAAGAVITLRSVILLPPMLF